MKLIDLKLTNFKKLSNLPQPTITFNEDITVLVGANNAGKTSILKSIQKLFKTKGVNPAKDLNYLIEDGNMLIEASLILTKQQWQSYLRISIGGFTHIKLDLIDTDKLAENLFKHPINLKHNLGFINQKLSSHTIIAEIDDAVLDAVASDEKQKLVIQDALSQFAVSDVYNVYHTPLFLDSKDQIQEQEKFNPLSQIKSQKANAGKVNIRGVSISLKKKSLKSLRNLKNDCLTYLQN